MRLNRYIAMYSDLSRRKADNVISEGRVSVNRKPAHVGMDVSDTDTIVVNSKRLQPVKRESMTVMLNKPVGFVCSKDGQGSPCVYDLLQNRMQHLNIAGRLDKDSSGLVILTDDGQLLQQLTHPSNNKDKVYEIVLDSELSQKEIDLIRNGVDIGDDRVSKFRISSMQNRKYRVTLQEGRNRQIRRTFEVIGKNVVSLHRTHLGQYSVANLKSEEFKEIKVL